MKKSLIRPCVVGLGYVGLPLFLKLQNKISTVGYDISDTRVKELKFFLDVNGEFKKKDLVLKKKSLITSDKNLLKFCNFFIVAVPTPISKKKLPRF